MNRSPVVLTPTQAADLADVSVATVYRAIRTGELRAVRIGRAIRLPYPAVGEWLGIDLPTPAPQPDARLLEVAQ